MKNLHLLRKSASHRKRSVKLQVSAYSTWDKELPKIVFDHRYSLLNAKERKNVFDVYTRNKAEEERRERNNKLKERKEEFKAMLEQSGISSRLVGKMKLVGNLSRAYFTAIYSALLIYRHSIIRQFAKPLEKTWYTNLISIELPPSSHPPCATKFITIIAKNSRLTAKKDASHG